MKPLYALLVPLLLPLSVMAAPGPASATAAGSAQAPAAAAGASDMVIATVPGPVQDVGPGLTDGTVPGLDELLRLHCEAVDAPGGAYLRSRGCAEPAGH